jgi:hypothetical protein
VDGVELMKKKKYDKAIEKFSAVKIITLLTRLRMLPQ